MANECRNISGTQQLSIVIRFVRNLSNRTINSSNVVEEYLLGFVPLQEFDAVTLANKIVEFSEGSSLDYVRGESLIISVMQQIKDLRNELSFYQIYDKAKEFCSVNYIDFIQHYQSHRKTTIPAKFQEFLINSTVGQL
ncbi:unnamed protein product [Rotaria sordida]|uniref:Uncharacterized protein n=1 Tax=Rotaria sordida TaxID=392033 RepID=A0A815FT67_9BILA|nr:unnamed protein product [Rotaria sordida]CAF1590255.1 unnamed protein product [Rotaria sordida]